MALIEAATLTPSEAAARAGFGRTKLMSLIKSGRLPARTIDGRIRVMTSDLDAFLDAMPQYRPGSLPAPSRG